MLTSDAIAGLKKFLKKNCEGETLAVVDSKLGSIIKEKLEIPCMYRCADYIAAAAATVPSTAA